MDETQEMEQRAQWSAPAWANFSLEVASNPRQQLEAARHGMDATFWREICNTEQIKLQIGYSHASDSGGEGSEILNCTNLPIKQNSQICNAAPAAAESRRILTSARVRTRLAQRNHLHSSTL